MSCCPLFTACLELCPPLLSSIGGHACAVRLLLPAVLKARMPGTRISAHMLAPGHNIEILLSSIKQLQGMHRRPGAITYNFTAHISAEHWCECALSGKRRNQVIRAQLAWNVNQSSRHTPCLPLCLCSCANRGEDADWNGQIGIIFFFRQYTKIIFAFFLHLSCISLSVPWTANGAAVHTCVHQSIETKVFGTSVHMIGGHPCSRTPSDHLFFPYTVDRWY